MSWRERAEPVKASWRDRAEKIDVPSTAGQPPKSEPMIPPVLNPMSVEGAKERGKIGLSVATGMAEALNPLAIPRGVEVIGRAAKNFATGEAGGSGIDRGLNALRKANEDAVMPQIGVSEIAAGVRTLAQPPMRGTGGKSFFESLKGTFAKELSDQEKYMSSAINPAVKGATELGVGVYSLGSGLRAAVNKFGAGKVATEMAKTKAFEALKPKGVYADNIVINDRARTIGDQLLKDGIVTPGATWGDMLRTTQDKIAKYGEEVGYYAKAADDAIARDSSIRKIQVDDIIEEANRKIIQPLIEDGAADTAKSVSDWLQSNLKSAATNGEIGYAQGNRIKTNLGKTKGKFQASGDSIGRDAFQDLYGIVNRNIEDGIDVALKTAAPSIHNNFIPVKIATRNLKDAEKFLEKTVSASIKNRMFSQSDYQAMLMGGITDPGDAAMTLAKGFAGAILNKAGRTMGNQGLASALYNLERETPIQALEAIKAAGAINLVSPRKRGE